MGQLQGAERCIARRLCCTTCGCHRRATAPISSRHRMRLRRTAHSGCPPSPSSSRVALALRRCRRLHLGCTWQASARRRTTCRCPSGRRRAARRVRWPGPCAGTLRPGASTARATSSWCLLAHGRPSARRAVRRASARAWSRESPVRSQTWPTRLRRPATATTATRRGRASGGSRGSSGWSASNPEATTAAAPPQPALQPSAARAGSPPPCWPQPAPRTRRSAGVPPSYAASRRCCRWQRCGARRRAGYAPSWRPRVRRCPWPTPRRPTRRAATRGSACTRRPPRCGCCPRCCCTPRR
jgi:hypothetical protein